AEFRTLEDQVKHSRRFFRDTKDTEYVDLGLVVGRFLPGLSELSAKGTCVRARIHREASIGDPPRPFTGGDIGAPPGESIKRGGRANPAGISYLYLSDSDETACVEVRAAPGDLITVGRFELAPDLRLVNLLPVT